MKKQLIYDEISKNNPHYYKSLTDLKFQTQTEEKLFCLKWDNVIQNEVLNDN